MYDRYSIRTVLRGIWCITHTRARALTHVRMNNVPDMFCRLRITARIWGTPSPRAHWTNGHAQKLKCHRRHRRRHVRIRLAQYLNGRRLIVFGLRKVHRIYVVHRRTSRCFSLADSTRPFNEHNAQSTDCGQSSAGKGRRAERESYILRHPKRAPHLCRRKDYQTYCIELSPGQFFSISVNFSHSMHPGTLITKKPAKRSNSVII